MITACNNSMSAQKCLSFYQFSYQQQNQNILLLLQHSLLSGYVALPQRTQAKSREHAWKTCGFHMKLPLFLANSQANTTPNLNLKFIWQILCVVVDSTFPYQSALAKNLSQWVLSPFCYEPSTENAIYPA